MSVNSRLRVIYIISQRKAFYRQRITWPSCARRATVDIDIRVTSRNGDREIMQSIRITSKPPSRKRNWNQLIQFKILPIQNHSKPSVTEKRGNKDKYLTWNSITPKFANKTRMPNPFKGLGYIKCYNLSSPRLVKSPSNSIRYNSKKICSWSRRPKTILEMRKKALCL